MHKILAITLILFFGMSAGVGAQPHSGYAGPIAYSPDGSLIATGGMDHLVKIWDAANGDNLYTLQGHQGVIYDVAWSPDGSHLASVSFVGELFIWDTETWILNDIDLYEYSPFTPSFFAVDWSPDSGKVVVSGHLTPTFIYDLMEEKYDKALSGHRKEVSSVAWSPDGAYILGAGWDGQLILWDASSGEILNVIMEPNLSIVGDVIEWHPDGSRAAVVNREGIVRVWDPFLGEIVQELFTAQTLLDVAWSNNGAYLAAVGEGTIHLWETNGYNLTQTIPLAEDERVYDIDFDPDSSTIVYYASSDPTSPIKTISLTPIAVSTPSAAIPTEADMLRALFGDECLMPCFMGIELDAMTMQDAINFLEANHITFYQEEFGEVTSVSWEAKYQTLVNDHPHILNITRLEFYEGSLYKLESPINVRIAAIFEVFGYPDRIVHEDNMYFYLYSDIGLIFMVIDSPTISSEYAVRLISTLPDYPNSYILNPPGEPVTQTCVTYGVPPCIAPTATPTPTESIP